ncbi:hypothetical protein HMPREF0240_01360 [Clostridium sp. D5]|nr:hypothetical protein HMPREF0240_01360 [Clostridium sp. D5]
MRGRRMELALQILIIDLMDFLVCQTILGIFFCTFIKYGRIMILKKLISYMYYKSNISNFFALTR